MGWFMGGGVCHVTFLGVVHSGVGVSKGIPAHQARTPRTATCHVVTTASRKRHFMSSPGGGGGRVPLPTLPCMQNRPS